MWKSVILSAFVLAAAACSRPAPQVAEPAALISLGEIDTDTAGRCFAQQDAPTEVQIVTTLIEVQAAVKDRNGVVTSPAIFRNVARPQTVAVGEGARFETVCPQVYTPQFVATLQRALIVRRAYDGAVTGLMDSPTSLALQQFQRGMGVDSPLLAIAVARDLGIVAVPRN